MTNIAHAHSSQNTDTPFRFDVLVRINFQLPSEREWSCVWARAEAFASNCINLRGAEIQEGEIIEGVLTATYGTHLSAVFNTWKTSDLAKWKSDSIGPPLDNSNKEGNAQKYFPPPFESDPPLFLENSDVGRKTQKKAAAKALPS